MNKSIILLSVVFILIAPIETSAPVAPVTIIGAGSTFAEVILNVWGNTFHTATNGSVTLNYGGGGSGQGIVSITNQTVDFAGSDIPLTPSQEAIANLNANSNGHHLGNITTIPESAGGITIAYNIPTGGITGPLNLTASLVAQMFQRNITNWGNPALKTNNLNPGLTSNANITVVHYSSVSGTTYAFSDYLTRAAHGLWTLGIGSQLNWPNDTIGAKGAVSPASEITSTPNSIGYVELAYVLHNQISTANIQNKAGYLVNMTISGITNAINIVSNSLPDATGDWSNVSINDQVGSTTYPICTLTYLFVYSNITAYGDIGADLIAFLKYIMTPAAQEDSISIGYVPLPVGLLTKNLATINSISYAPTSSGTIPSSSSGISTSPSFEFSAFASLLFGAFSIKMPKRKILNSQK